jgi:hypothetical protein
LKGEPVTERSSAESIDFALLDEASKRLLGYYVHRKFRSYLSSITAGLHRQYQNGLSEGLTRPTPRGRATLFDFGALDYDVLVALVGVYMYVLSCHKSANWRLLHRSGAKRVLYLRGYDFEAAFATGGSVAAGISTIDTTGFTLKLPSLLERQLFKVLSPKEIDTETVTSERYYEDFDAMIQWINQRPAAVVLNALHWKRGVLQLIPRMDHYIVYVSSLTGSALWELEQLRTEQYRNQVTVVFDEEAIEKKASQMDLQQALAGRLGETIWSKRGVPPSLTAAKVREGLAEVFTVMKPDEFEANIEDVKRRVDHSRSELSPEERETWLDFEFYPAVPDNDLERLQETSRDLAALVDAGQTGPIDCLPLHFTQIQLRIYLTLLLGDHAATGRALAAYAAVVQGVSDHLGPKGGWADALPDQDRPQLLTTLANHRAFSE